MRLPLRCGAAPRRDVCRVICARTGTSCLPEHYGGECAGYPHNIRGIIDQRYLPGRPLKLFLPYPSEKRLGAYRV